jgi:hypothetical protein
LEMNCYLGLTLAHYKLIEMERAALHIRQVKEARQERQDAFSIVNGFTKNEIPDGNSPENKKVRHHAGIHGV